METSGHESRQGKVPRYGMGVEADGHGTFADGCDPCGVVEECGWDVYPGSATPGYWLGMLRIPQ